MENKVYTYKFYDSKKRRLSIMGRLIDGNIEITIITCSKQDMFSRAEARNGFSCIEIGQLPVVNNSVAKPTRVVIKANTAKWQREFYQYCMSNFYKKYTKRRVFNVEFLEKGMDRIYLTNKMEIFKMDA